MALEVLLTVSVKEQLSYFCDVDGPNTPIIHH